MEESLPPVAPSPTPLAKSSPNLVTDSDCNSRNTVHIGGISVDFPYQPYGTQMAFMNRVISTLDRSQREGHCHALLESPTGTGKSLSLLCSALAWQQNQKLKNIRAHLTHSSSRANPEAVTDPINHGGGFIPETQPSGNPTTDPSATANAKKEKAKLAATIFYSSRTHAQISQVIREYKKTTYRVPMAVLGSRKHYCTNPHLRGEDKVDEQCKLLLKNRENSCPEFKNVHKVKGHPSIKKGGCHEVHDIEDLVKIGQIVKGCSYFAARSMAQDAELVFCPYNYLINPIIRDAMEIDISGSIIILDEAHNIEDIARDAGSVDLDEEALLYLQTELGKLALDDGMTYQPLFEMTQDILSWMSQRRNTLVKREFQHYFYCWTGEKALKELHEANISMRDFPALKECAKKAIKAASEAAPEVPYLSGMAATTLEGLLSSLTYFFSGNGVHANDYEVALQRFLKKDTGGWTNTFSLWCLNPAVVFKGIAETSQSVILTSGTLSPLNTFTSELGVEFGTCLEAPHVIDVYSQVWAGAISNGPGNYPLNASYKTADEYAFQDAVGTSLEEICKVVPGGCLVFFPSYKLLDKLSTRWQETGQWSRLNAQKSLFVEPRGSSQEFEPVLKNYYDSIRKGTRQVGGRKIQQKRLGLKNGNLPESTKDTKKEGAALLAVCRGKVSEGMDFSDDNARAVVIVGIPFPNIYDIKVAQKKKFNDTYELSKKLLSGNEWYCQQAFRALNQATGRCIRHRLDYGAIIFLDERFHKDRNRANISKWLRKSIRLYSCFEESMESLKSFFRDVKACVDTGPNSSQIVDVKCETLNIVDKKNGTRKKSTKISKASCCQQKIESYDNLDGREAARSNHLSATKYKNLSTRARSDVVILTDDNNACVSREYIDLERDSEQDSRWSATPSVALPSDDDLELTIVKETPGVNDSSPKATPEIFSTDDYSTPTINNPSTAPPRQSSFQPRFIINSDAKANTIEPEAESSWSVNSNALKRRRVTITGLSSVGPLSEFSNTAQVPDRSSSLASSITTADATRKTEETSPSEVECAKYKPFLSPNTSDRSSAPSGFRMEKRLHIFCSRCKTPLGLPENNSSATCSIISTSKIHLMSLLKKTPGSNALSTPSTNILMSDSSSVNHCLRETAKEGASGQGIWCKEDGCVYNSIFCPSCVEPDNCLGVEVVATDALNIKFLNKILLFPHHLEIKKFSAEINNLEATKDEALSSPVDSSMVKNLALSMFEKFAYKSPSQDTKGWRNPKSHMRLPKKR